MESTAIAHAEIVVDDFPQDLIYTIEREKLDKATVKSVLEEFALTVSLGEVSTQARAIVVTDETQTDLMRQAGDLRIRIRDERLRIDKIRETVKKPYLLKTQAIDGIARIIRTKFQEEETYLAEQEQFAKIQQRKREDKLQAEREAALREFAYDGNFSGLHAMDQSQFDLLLAGAKASFIEKKEAIERQTREREEQMERERLLRVENDRLRHEKENAERAAQLEREESDRKIREAEASARLEREAAAARERERLEAEAAERRRIADEKSKAAAAPDREKLIAFADAIAAVELPTLVSPDAQKLIDRIAHDRETLVSRIKSEAESLRFGDCPF